jgi:hypothetical protein
MNIAPPKEAHPDLGRTLNHMLLWLAPPVHAPGDFARQLCRREWWKIERKRTRRRRRCKRARSAGVRTVVGEHSPNSQSYLPGALLVRSRIS